MSIETFRQRVGLVITAAYIWLSALPLGMLINQYGVVKNVSAEQHYQTPAMESIDAVYLTCLGYESVDEPKNVVTRSVQTSNTFVISAYCGENYPHICNNGDSSTTATGTTPTAGRTIAVDPNVIPYGSEVIIDGHSYIAEDCGGAIKGNRIDLFFSTHEEALSWGKKTKEVIIKN